MATIGDNQVARNFLKNVLAIIGTAFLFTLFVFIMIRIFGKYFGIGSDLDPNSYIYITIWLDLSFLSAGIVYILYVTLHSQRDKYSDRKLVFALKYITIAMITAGAFMLALLNSGPEMKDIGPDIVDKVLTLYAGIAGYVLGSFSPRTQEEGQLKGNGNGGDNGEDEH